MLFILHYNAITVQKNNIKETKKLEKETFEIFYKVMEDFSKVYTKDAIKV